MKNFYKKVIYIFMIFIITLILNKVNTFANINSIKNFEEKIILIDPGHGGIDGGTASKKGTLEKDINLQISLKLKENLKKLNFKVMMTREEDKGLYKSTKTAKSMKAEDLSNRCKMKKESNCHAFISIHQNDFIQSKYRGAQVWYGNSQSSKRLAAIIQANMIEDLNHGNTRTEKAAGEDYKILRCCKEVPSVIIECGFLSNPKEELLLKSESYQQSIADSIAKSIAEFFEDT